MNLCISFELPCKPHSNLKLIHPLHSTVLKNICPATENENYKKNSNLTK